VIATLQFNREDKKDEEKFLAALRGDEFRDIVIQIDKVMKAKSNAGGAPPDVKKALKDTREELRKDLKNKKIDFLEDM